MYNIHVINCNPESLWKADMTPEMKERARRSLDKRLAQLPDAALFQRPPRGWVRAIRQSLGMTTAQLAARMGVSQPRIPVLEKAEETRSITLDSLERAAHALDCELVYVFVPRASLQDHVESRARDVAQRRLFAVAHTMAIENQGVSRSETELQIAKLARDLAEKSGSELWDEA